MTAASVTAGPELRPVSGRRPGWAALVAATLAVVAVVLRLRGVDLPASLYRVGLFHREGLSLWDSQWYAGHWTLNYSVIFAPVAATLGVPLTEVASAGVAAWMFDRLVTAHLGPGVRVGSLLFAFGTLAQVAIGQLPFLLGEALAMSACWAMTRRRPGIALPLALASSLASPLAGAFLGLAATAWLIEAWPQRRSTHAALAAAAVAPALILTTVFPGQGAMPFPTLDFVALFGLTALGAIAVPSRHRGLRIAVSLYLVAIAMSYLLPMALGGNVSRLGECVGAPLLTCVLWPQRRRLLPFVAVPIALLQWGPALATFSTNPADLSTHAAYFRPLVSFLRAHGTPLGRVEVVPTSLHWEAAYVAPVAPLARGWERQLDTADNPLFYRPHPLDPATYRAWLLENGVRYVALPDVALDYAATREAQLLRRGIPGLRVVWRSAHWRVYAVSGAPGMLTGPARLTQLAGNHVHLEVLGPGELLLRVRYSSLWQLTSGQACLAEGMDGWTAIEARAPGHLSLQLGIGSGPSPTCPPGGPAITPRAPAGTA